MMNFGITRSERKKNPKSQKALSFSIFFLRNIWRENNNIKYGLASLFISTKKYIYIFYLLSSDTNTQWYIIWSIYTIRAQNMTTNEWKAKSWKHIKKKTKNTQPTKETTTLNQTLTTMIIFFCSRFWYTEEATTTTNKNTPNRRSKKKSDKRVNLGKWETNKKK